MSTERKGIIAWFARNPVAANLLMAVIMVVGLASALSIQRAMFPAFDLEVITISVPYPGAAPEEVEKGVILKIEEALSDLDGIKRIESDAFESFASMFMEPQEGTELSKLLDDVKNRIDAIQHFPEEAETPIISQPELRFPALILQISGGLDERGMKTLAEEIRRELLTLPEISAAEISGARDYEIAVEISEQQLREYHLSLGDVAQRIAASSLDLPAGSVQTENGDIMLRTLGQAYVQADFESIVLKTWPDGTRLLLGDIANINDGFEDGQGFSIFNGSDSLGINVFAIGKQDVVQTAKAARRYAEKKQHELPAGVSLQPWADITYYLEGRLGMMVKNLAMGALLVFIVLALFLELKLAFWVMLGIPVCFLGAMAFINTPFIDASLNMISLFGFILVLGIVVDDAIIMGESAYAEQEAKGRSVNSVIDGVYKVSTPATFGVLTTIAAFMPTLFVSGTFGAFPEACGWVVILCLTFSLVESKWILPAHLAHSTPARNRLMLAIDRLQQNTNQRLRNFVENQYTPFVERCLAHRYVTLTAFISILILCSGLLFGGVVRTVIAPEVPGEFLQAELRMAEGTPDERTLQALQEVSNALLQVEAQYRKTHNDKLVEHTYIYGFDRINGRVEIELTKEDKRSLTTRQVEQAWREAVGTIHGADVFSISAAEGPEFGPDIAIDLKHSNFDVLREAAAELKEKLHHYEGLYDIRNGAGDTSEEFHIDILPEGQALGLSRLDLGSQVRHAFFGAEAQRIQRGIDEVKVMVRYPKADRETVSSLGEMFVRTPDGNEVPFESVARLNVKQGLRKATHIDFQRAAEVTAEADKSLVEPGKVMADITDKVLPEMMERYPGLSYGISGISSEEEKALISMMIGFGLALFGIYALLAIPTHSYLQPLIIMGVIPFGVIGAIVGHWLTGYPMSMMSMMGVIALSGVVVNDSLILVDFINKAVASGEDLYQSVLAAGKRRFRAILLTSLTTFFGLAPMLLERSAQAQEIVPMAISLAFGIVFATVITLLLVPCLYMILADLGRWWGSKRAVQPLAHQ